MTAPPRTDPAPAPVAAAGSRRPRVVLVLAAGVVAAALVRGLVLETYVVPMAVTAPAAPIVEPGDRVLVLKTDHRAESGDLALVEGEDGAGRLVPSTALRGEAVGSVVLRVWPLDRFGRVTLTGAGS